MATTILVSRVNAPFRAGISTVRMTVVGRLQPEAETPVGDFWLNVAEKFGKPMERFGDSTGKTDVLV